MRLFLITFLIITIEARIRIIPPIGMNHDSVEGEEFSCHSRDGLYSAGPCKNHYFSCHEEFKTIVYCPMGLIFNGEHCAYKEETPGCPAYKSDWDIFNSKHKSIRDTICERKVDGECNFDCSEEYFSCKNGTVTWQKCQAGHVRHSGQCIGRVLHKKCVNVPLLPYIEKNAFCITNTPKTDNKKVENTKKEFSCLQKIINGHYSAGPCLNHFNICLDKKQITAQCPNGMVFTNTCHFKRDVKECPEYKTDLDLYRSGNKTLKNSICEIRADGRYEFDCENEHYECKDGKTIWMKCPPGEVYNFSKCVKKIDHYMCPEYVESDDEFDKEFEHLLSRRRHYFNNYI